MVSYAAGILPYYKRDNETYILLGRDKRMKWSDFGGKCEVKDNQNPIYTASREFYEETSGSICSIYRMSKSFSSKNNICLKGKSYTNKNYYMFMVNIENILVKEQIDEVINEFDDCRDFLNRLNYMDKKYLEKNKLKWISIKQLYEPGSKDHLRQVFYNTVMLAENKAILRTL